MGVAEHEAVVRVDRTRGVTLTWAAVASGASEVESLPHVHE
jgi:hypothetical protein